MGGEEEGMLSTRQAHSERNRLERAARYYSVRTVAAVDLLTGAVGRAAVRVRRTARVALV